MSNFDWYLQVKLFLQNLPIVYPHTRTTSPTTYRKEEHHVRTSVAKNLTGMGNSLQNIFANNDKSMEMEQPQFACWETNNQQTKLKESLFKADFAIVAVFMVKNNLFFRLCLCLHTRKISNYKEAAATDERNKRGAPFRSQGLRTQKMIMKWQMSLRKAMRFLT